MPPAVPVPRWLRAVFVAGCSITISVLAHSVAGGCAPDTAHALVVAVFGALAVYPATERPMRAPLLLALLALGQVLTHLVWSMLAAWANPVVGGHGHHGGHEVAAGGAMFWWHTVGVVVCAALIHVAEHCWRRTSAWLLPLVCWVDRGGLVRQSFLNSFDSAVTPTALVVVRHATRRGPPVLR